MKEIDITNITEIEDLTLDIPRSICKNDNIYIIAKDVLFHLNQEIITFYRRFMKEDIDKTNITKEQVLFYLNFPIKYLKEELVKKYLYGTLTENDNKKIASNKRLEIKLSFIFRSIIMRDTIIKTFDMVNATKPLSETNQTRIFYIYNRIIYLYSEELKHIGGNATFFGQSLLDTQEAITFKRKQGGLTKGKNAIPFKKAMYEEQKEWYFSKKGKGITPFAKDFAKTYYKKCKDEYRKNPNIKFPFHFTKEKSIETEEIRGERGISMEDDNAFKYLYLLARENNKELKKVSYK